MSEYVVMVDPVKVLTDYLFTLLPTMAETTGLTVGTKVQPGVTPTDFVQVRKIGGTEEDGVAERPRLDIRIWKTGDAARSLTARVILAHIRRDIGCRVFAVPVDLPDPADPSKSHTLFSIEPLLLGVQT